MQIKRLENDEYKDYAMYEINDPGLVEPVFYLAINKDTKLVNVYSLNDKGKPNRVDLTNIQYRTGLETQYNAKEGVLVFNKPDDLDQFLVDILGEHASIITQDLNIQLDQRAQEKISLDLTSPPESKSAFNDFSTDEYQGLSPDVIDVLTRNASEEGDSDSLSSSDDLTIEDGGFNNEWSDQDNTDTEEEEEVPEDQKTGKK